MYVSLSVQSTSSPAGEPRQVRSVCADRSMARVRGEYLEMPGLQLTIRQAARLLGLDEGMCARLLDSLAQQGFLRLTPRGQYARADTV
jgi:hypothetical protein